MVMRRKLRWLPIGRESLLAVEILKYDRHEIRHFCQGDGDQWHFFSISHSVCPSILVTFGHIRALSDCYLEKPLISFGIFNVFGVMVIPGAPFETMMVQFPFLGIESYLRLKRDALEKFRGGSNEAGADGMGKLAFQALIFLSMCLCLDEDIMTDAIEICEVRWLDIISNFEDQLVR